MLIELINRLIGSFSNYIYRYLVLYYLFIDLCNGECNRHSYRNDCWLRYAQHIIINNAFWNC